MWVAIYTIVASLPFVPQGWPPNGGFTWSAVNYSPLVLFGVIAAVAIWWFVSARNTFKGPIRTIDLGAVAPSPGVAPAQPTTDI